MADCKGNFSPGPVQSDASNRMLGFILGLKRSETDDPKQLSARKALLNHARAELLEYKSTIARTWEWKMFCRLLSLDR